MKLFELIKQLQNIEENTKLDFDDVEVYLLNDDIPLTKDGLVIGNCLSLQWIFDDSKSIHYYTKKDVNEKL